MTTTLVARQNSRVVGSAALELHADGALLRSVAVAPEMRGQGLGRELTDAAIRPAQDIRVPCRYLLTTTAEQYFAKFGFVRIERTAVPATVHTSIAFTVIVAAPVKSGALNIVGGVNDHLYDPSTHRLLTAASCTTNCLAPVVKVIHEAIGIRHGVITTIHDITNTQVVVDAPHKDLRRARASSLSLIPTSTGSATAIALIYPELLGKLTGIAVRVPLLNASLTDCVFEVRRPTTVDEVNAAFKRAAEGPLEGILGYEERPLVSVDYKDDARSAIVDALSTMVVDGTCVKVLAWYDNEIAYVHRMIELAQKVGASL